MKLGNKLTNLKFKTGDDSFMTNKSFSGNKVVIYFYPKDDTPGCTKEAIEFSENKSNFQKFNTIILGVSKDSVEKHEKFKSKHNLTVDLASDDDGKICDTFGVWVEKSMYGKKYMGIERSTFLFDENSKLIKVWRNVKVKNHVNEVLNFLDSID